MEKIGGPVTEACGASTEEKKKVRQPIQKSVRPYLSKEKRA